MPFICCTSFGEGQELVPLLYASCGWGLGELGYGSRTPPHDQQDVAPCCRKEGAELPGWSVEDTLGTDGETLPPPNLHPAGPMAWFRMAVEPKRSVPHVWEHTTDEGVFCGSEILPYMFYMTMKGKLWTLLEESLVCWWHFFPCLRKVHPTCGSPVEETNIWGRWLHWQLMILSVLHCREVVEWR